MANFFCPWVPYNFYISTYLYNSYIVPGRIMNNSDILNKSVYFMTLRIFKASPDAQKSLIYMVEQSELRFLNYA